jgi:hypothetical protein
MSEQLGTWSVIVPFWSIIFSSGRREEQRGNEENKSRQAGVHEEKRGKERE